MFYHEGTREIPFFWEYGGGDVRVIVRFEEPSRFALRYPWAVEHIGIILERVAQELIRGHAPDCRAEVDEPNLCIYVQGQTAG